MAFGTTYGYFEYNVMSFNLLNALDIIQHLMNNVYLEFLVIFVVCYQVDMLVFFQNKKDHLNHVLLVLLEMQTADLYAKLKNLH